MDFSILPPETISGLIWTGPGAGALQNAVGAWTTLADQLDNSSTEVRSVISGLSDAWKGPSSADMISSTQAYLAWMTSTAEQAHRTASAASAAATAFETARSEIVPPAVVTSNRSQLLYLISTNLVGQNAAAIAANEAQYAAMWAQDATAMNQYSLSSFSATAQLPTFTAAPQVANLSANPTEAAASVAAPAAGEPIGTILSNLFTPGSFLYDSFQSILSSGAPIDIVALFTQFFGPFLGSTMIAGNIAAQNAIIAGKPTVPSVVYPPTAAAEAKPEVKASAGTAERLGPMRVPPSWAQPKFTPQGTPLAPPPPGKDRDHAIGLPVIPAVPVTGGRAKKRPGYSDPDDMHYGRPSPTILPRNPAGG